MGLTFGKSSPCNLLCINFMHTKGTTGYKQTVTNLWLVPTQELGIFPRADWKTPPLSNTPHFKQEASHPGTQCLQGACPPGNSSLFSNLIPNQYSVPPKHYTYHQISRYKETIAGNQVIPDYHLRRSARVPSEKLQESSPDQETAYSGS